MLSVHHVRATVYAWDDAPLPLVSVCLVSLGISPGCLCVSVVMETAAWQVLGGREGWAVGKWPGFYSIGREGRGGTTRGETSEARRRWLMESWEGFDMEEEELDYLLPLCFKACCHCVVWLTSNQPFPLSVLIVGPVLITAACTGFILV